MDAERAAGQGLKATDMAAAEYFWAKGVGDRLLLQACWEWQDASRSIKRPLSPKAIAAMFRHALAIATDMYAPGRPRRRRP